MDFKLFKILLGVEIVLLLIQFWLGMSVNLFVALPTFEPLRFASYSGGGEVLAHMINAVLVLALGALIVSYSFRLGSKYISWLSIFALAFSIVASGTGYTFSVSGQDSSLSMAMAMSFVVIYTIYFSIFYLVSRHKAVI